MKTSKRGIDLIKQFEGLRLTAYKAVPSERYYTIGYGHYGSDVKKDMVISRQEAEDILIKDLERFERSVSEFDSIYHFNQNEFDALVSFAYNCGSIGQLTQNGKRNRHDIVQAMKLYVKSGGLTLQGLVRRRQAEIELFTEPIQKSVNEIVKDYVETKQLIIDILKGKYGNGAERVRRLTEKGYDAKTIQMFVNSEYNIYVNVAKQVWKGNWGNGQERKDRLTRAGYDAELVQDFVNKLAKGEIK